MKQLSLFNKDSLSYIIKSFGSQPKIFSSEAQFQFELAWEIQKQYDCDVKLEELTKVYSIGSKQKREFTDIVLEKGDIRIAIELKYKTASLLDIKSGVFLMNQGAVDLGSFDFLWDIHRLETLKGNLKKPSVQKNDFVKDCKVGYVVMLTNDKRYWIGPKSNSAIYKEFQISGNPDSGTITKGKHCWLCNGCRGKVPATADGFRKYGITFKNSYSYKWEDYSKSIQSCLFRFIIVEV